LGEFYPEEISKDLLSEKGPRVRMNTYIDIANNSLISRNEVN
jgi:hypothetical protein